MRTKSVEYYDFNELEDKVSENLKRDVRDYYCMFGNPHNLELGAADASVNMHSNPPDGKPGGYCDFWHWWLEEIMYDDCHNGTLQEDVNFTEIRDNALEENAEAWIIEVLNEFIKILGPDGDRCINVRHCW